MVSVVTEMWKFKVAETSSGGWLCMELFAALRMSEGMVTLQADGSDEALRRGLLVVHLPQDRVAERGLQTVRVNMHDEPVTVAALLELDEDCVFASSGDADRDPIFRLLSRAMSSASIAGFNLTTSIKGDVLELAFAWHVQQRVLLNRLADGRRSSLHAVLEPLAASDFIMPFRAADEYVVASRGIVCRNEPLTPRQTDLHRVCRAGGEDLVLYDVHPHAGTHVAFQTVTTDGHPASVVMVQAKAQKRAPFADCLRAASPAWQFTQEPDCAAVLAEKPFMPLKTRLAFQKLATAAATWKRFSAAFRVVLSVTGYNPGLVSMLNVLNARPEACLTSPILLCQPSAAAFGARLDAQLRNACKGGAPADNPVPIAFVLLQNVANVTAGMVTRVYTDTVQRALVGSVGGAVS
jgi:hypothetical protein